MSFRTGALDKALAEDTILARKYRAAKKAQFLELCAASECGERLRKFVGTLMRFKIDDAERMISYVSTENDKWLCYATLEIRQSALEAIGERIMKIRERAGYPPLDDPLPGEEDDVFRVSKRVLGL